jgi:hypothetical protein
MPYAPKREQQEKGKEIERSFILRYQIVREQVAYSIVRNSSETGCVSVLR